MSLKSFSEALMERTSSVASGLGAKAYRTFAPQRALPYVIVAGGDSMGQEFYTDCDDTVEGRQVLFTVYTDDEEQAHTILQAISKSFHTTALTLESGTVLAAYPGSMGVEPDPELSAVGEEVWQGRLSVEFQLQRSMA